jgi:fructose-1,6-bisphosphatase/inositol monophosphatase family enzyme
MSYKAKYGALLDDIANEADRMAMSYFRGGAMGAERKRDGTVVTQADKRIEQMAARE